MTTPRPATLDIDTSRRYIIGEARDAAINLQSALHLLDASVSMVGLASLIDDLQFDLDALSCGQCGNIDADHELSPESFEYAQRWLESIDSDKVESGLRCDSCWKDLTE
jgi:hypothetical protein